MKKVMHEYKNVVVPEDAKEIVDAIYLKAKARNHRIRKADVWLAAARNVSVSQVLKGE